MTALRRFILKKPQLRPASKAEVIAIARPLWVLLNQHGQHKDDPTIDVVLAAALGLVANLAYCAIDADERERSNRAKLIPCLLHQRLLQGEWFDFVVAMRSGADLADVTIIRTRLFVAIVVPAGTKILVGIRGTQFAYDWVLNLWATKRRRGDGPAFHTGFAREAEALGILLKKDLEARYASWTSSTPLSLYLAGHSLGGAIAAILNQADDLPRAACCYTFGAPRIGSKRALALGLQPIAVRRELDIVPHCPPRFLNYGEYRDQRRVDGTPFQRIDAIEIHFFISWLAEMALRSFPANHSMDRYVDEMISYAKGHPAVAEHWARWEHDKTWPYDAENI
jgi:hypothetical protein